MGNIIAELTLLEICLAIVIVCFFVAAFSQLIVSLFGSLFRKMFGGRRKPKPRKVKKPSRKQQKAAKRVVQRQGSQEDHYVLSGQKGRMAHLANYLEVNPDAGLTEMANEIGVNSRETVRRYLNEMGKAAPDHDQQPGTPFSRR